MHRCQACPPDTDVDAAFVATYDDPAVQDFRVCPRHAAEALASNATVTPAPLTELED